MGNYFEENIGSYFIKNDRLNLTKWLKIIITFLPLLLLGLYKGGESHILIYLFGIYIIVLLVYKLKKEDFSLEKNIFFLPFAIFILSSFISTVFSPSLYTSVAGFGEYFSYFLFFVILIFIKPEKNRMILALFIFSFIELIICFTQAGTGRVSGSYNYATYIVIPLIFGLVLSYEYIQNKPIKFSLLVLFLFASLLTGSRVVFVMLLVTPFLLFRNKIFWISVPLVLGLILLVPNPVGKRIKGRVDIYSMQRPKIWKQAVNTAMDRPVTGWGLRNYSKASLKYNFPVKGKYSRSAKIAHNQFLHYFSEGGVLLLFSYLFIFYVFFLNFKRIERTGRILIIIILIHSLLDNAVYLPANFLLMVCVLYIYGKKGGYYKVRLSRGMKWLVLMLSLLFLLPLASSILIYRGENSFKNKEYRRSYKLFNIAESIWPHPRNTTALAMVQEQFFIETMDISQLYFSFYLYNQAMKSDPLDWKIPFKIYEFLKRNKEYVGVKRPEVYLEKAIEINPKEKKLYEYLINEFINREQYRKADYVRYIMRKKFGF